MPTENERKYVMNLDCENDVKVRANSRFLIHQGYLVASKGISLRVRSSLRLGENSEERYYMTFKHTVKGRVIEIEQRIDKRDFSDLWEVAMNKLVKVRYKTKDARKHTWEIDFFRDHHDHTYFVMAEHEMPEGQIEPAVMPSEVADNLVFTVPLTDTRFSSKLLADVRYAKSMYQDLKKEPQ